MPYYFIEVQLLHIPDACVLVYALEPSVKS
nr:MAG TPA: hypothetical protein [Caudoviricetes sp.]